MPEMIILIGPPAAGKTTIRDRITQSSGKEYTIVSSDDLLDQYAAENGTTYDKVFRDQIKPMTAKMNEILSDALRSGENIIVDRTNMSKKSRKQFIDKAKQYNYRLIAVTVKTPDPKEHARRLLDRSRSEGKTIPPEIVKSMMNSFEEPTKEEGFDEIWN